MQTDVRDASQQILMLLDCQRRVLERIASGAPLSETLLTLVMCVERHAPAQRCAILQLDRSGKRLDIVAAPNIPDDLKACLGPFLGVGPDMANCGRAAFWREPVYTEDIALDPLWVACRDVALRNGIRAVWSTPVVSDDHTVLGTFAMFFGEPGLPKHEHVQLIDMAVQMARIAIQGKQDEERLRASEQKYRLIAEHARDLISLMEPSGRRLYASPSFAALYGRPPGSLEGGTAFEAVVPEERAQVEQDFKARLARGTGWRAEFRVVGKQGVRHLQIENSPILDASGRTTAVLGVGRDVTEERRTQQVLHERTDLLHTIFEHVPAGVAMADLNQRVLRANPTFARLLGYAEDELKGLPVDSLTHEDDRSSSNALLGELFDGKPGPIAIEKRYRRKDGTIVWVRATVSLVRGPLGEPRYTVALVEDITERKRVEEHLRLVINTIPTTAWSLEADGTLDFVNQRYLEYTGLSLEEALANPTKLIHPDDLPRALENRSAAMAAGREHEDEMRLRRADGEYRWFLVRTRSLRNEQGQIIKWYGSSIDIEARKRTERALQQSAHRLQQLSRQLLEVQEEEHRRLARELHDSLGATLTSLSINLAALKDRTAADPEARARVDDSAALLQSTAAAVENIVAGLRPPLLDDHGLPAALDYYCKQFAARVGVEVAVQATDDAEHLAPDVAITLFRIAQEGLNNVAKHARAERVVIALWRAPSEFVMSISDDGIGLPAESLDQRSTGFGLVTMRERAEAIGGTLKVEGLPVHGTRLTVKVPQ